jgi:DNA protecting protein DprA
MNSREQPNLFDAMDDQGPDVVEFDTQNESSLYSTRWLRGLLALEGIGSVRALRIANHFKGVDSLMSAGDEGVQELVKSKNVSILNLKPNDSNLEAEFGIQTIGYFDPAYPVGLRDLHDAPAVLWIRGKISSNKSVAIVGTRNADSRGLLFAGVAAQACIQNGFDVVSGLALGIDTAAHSAALESDGLTVAILACDIRYPTPKSNIGLANDILEQGGCLVSEVPLGRETNAQALIARNRIQAAWSSCLLMPQCGIPSGTLHTVRFAMELDRKIGVFTPPSGSDDEIFAGNIALLNRSGCDPKILGGNSKTSGRISRRTPFADKEIASREDIVGFLKAIV